MKIKRQKFDRNSGFTLLELLLVMAILVVLASLSTVAIFSMQKSAYSKNALVEIKTLKDACKAYRLNVGSFPSQLDDLYNNPSGLSRAAWGGPYVEEPVEGDPWNRPYKYTADEANDMVTITSSGPDGASGTDDDIPGASTNG